MELGDNDSGYGIWSFGDNNEWQKYTDSPDNIRIVFEDPNDVNNGYLQIAALCGDPDNGIAATAAPKTGGGVVLQAAGPELLVNGGFDDRRRVGWRCCWFRRMGRPSTVSRLTLLSAVQPALLLTARTTL